MKNERKIVIKLDSSCHQFPIEVLNHWDITDLEIIGGNLSYFPEDITILKELRSFSLVSSHIKQIPSQLFELPNLTYLNLKNNLIESLPILSKKTHLNTLVLNRNKIESFDIDKSYMPNLQVLDLSFNQLKIPPRFLSENCSLIRLNLESNQLTQFDFTHEELSSINHLCLDDNLFSKKEKNKIQKEFNITLE